MMTRYRPLWSFDVSKTEAWLSDQSKNGFHVRKLSRFRRGFSFQKGEPRDVTYRIGHDKNQTSVLSRSLVEDGWDLVAQSGGWFVTANEKELDAIKTFTSQESIIKRNRMIAYFYYFLIIYISFVALTNIGIFAIAYFSDIPMTVEESPYWIITYMVFAIISAFYILMVYSVIKIRRSNKVLSEEKRDSSTLNGWNMRNGVTKKEEYKLRRNGMLFKKRRFGWFYSPDKTEKWLEGMEAEGNNLLRLNKLGTTFIFVKGTPRNMKYCADYQNLSKDSYFDIHRQAGWKEVYSSYSSLQKWTIWSKEYEEGEAPPQMYSDNKHKLKHAKRVATSYTLLFTPLILMYLFITGMNLLYRFTTDSWSINETNTVMFFLLLTIFGSYLTKLWMYYFRLKKEATTETP